MDIAMNRGQAEALQKWLSLIGCLVVVWPMAAAAQEDCPNLPDRAKIACLRALIQAEKSLSLAQKSLLASQARQYPGASGQHKVAERIATPNEAEAGPLRPSGDQPSNRRFAARQLDAREKDMIAGAVRTKLNEPDSARFKWYPFNGLHYCGEVNAKNGPGGYIGFDLFRVDVWLDGTNHIERVDNSVFYSRKDSTATRLNCMASTE
jgi:hypothetical protein